MRYITRLGVAATAAMGASLAAQAADLGAPVSRAPVYKEVYLWAGFYAGVNAGYGWSRTEVDPLGNSLFCEPFFNGCAPTTPGSPFPTAQIASIPASIGTNGKGGMIGGQAGFNYQSGPYVLGVEADLDWTNIGASGTQAGIAPVTGFGNAAYTTTATADQRLRYFGTLRARLGFTPAVYPTLLIYMTGGLAYGGLSSSTSVAQIITTNCNNCVVTPGTGSESVVRAGWTVGGGLEYLLAGDWSVKAEYLYFNLGSTNYSLAPLGQTSAGILFTTVGVTSTTGELKGNVVRIGLNYKFAR
jgi:outer membrane immunogenic protein